jgi:hypothetical protein
MMIDPINRAAQLVAVDDVFKAIGFAALKARASNMEPGDIARTGDYSLVVAEDEDGSGTVVQMILEKERIEKLAFEKAEQLDQDFSSLQERERRQWMASFLKYLKDDLEKWHQIKMRPGPGENFTFEKAIYRKDDSWR